LILNTDNDGLGFIRNYNLGVSFAVRVPLTKWIRGQAGIKAAWLRKHIAWDEFEMSEKMKENYGNIYDSGFIRPDSDVINQPDFAIGGLIQVTNSKGRMSGTVGAAVDHLFEPNVSFLPGESSLLPRKWVGHADVIWRLKGHSALSSSEEQVMKINAGIVFQHQQDLNSVLAGLNVTKYGLYAGLWYKGEFGLHKANSISLLGGYRYVFAENMSIKFTYSYDKQVSGVQKDAGGAHEISLLLEFNDIRLFRDTKANAIRSGQESAAITF
jgi:type IX secretion system PorP/SprF family membrane protein